MKIERKRGRKEIVEDEWRRNEKKEKLQERRKDLRLTNHTQGARHTPYAGAKPSTVLIFAGAGSQVVLITGTHVRHAFCLCLCLGGVFVMKIKTGGSSFHCVFLFMVWLRICCIMNALLRFCCGRGAPTESITRTN